MSIRDIQSGRAWKLGSHWNRKKLRDDGTSVYWDKDKSMWGVKVVRHGGYFDSLQEATLAMEEILGKTENEVLLQLGTSLHDQLNEPIGPIEGDVIGGE